MTQEALDNLVSEANDYATLRASLTAARSAAASYLEIPASMVSIPDGCAVTLANLLNDVGIPVPMSAKARKLVNYLQSFDGRGWIPVQVGLQQPGDVGVTLDKDDPPGPDHVYLVVSRLDDDAMMVADNQATDFHRRLASGGEHTRTAYFLRPATVKQNALNGATLTATQVDAIIALVNNSPVRTFAWPDRGRAPIGYLYGMAVAFAFLYSNLDSDATVRDMARPVNMGDAATDALAFYANEYEAADLTLSNDPAMVLRRLFVLLTGLGMRESSGRHFVGRDMSATNVTSDTAEAGLFQSSFNLVRGITRYDPILVRYAGTTALLDLFSQGVKAKPDDLRNWGDEAQGLNFQKLSKECPLYAVEVAALGLRYRRRHWGPINNRHVDLNADWDALLSAVQSIVHHQYPVAPGEM